MEDIINKIVVNKKDSVFDRIELELNFKIEKEKTKQLELIKDIRKIEKSIKEKELYCKRKKIVYMDDCDSDSEEYDSSDDENNASNMRRAGYYYSPHTRTWFRLGNLSVWSGLSGRRRKSRRNRRRVTRHRRA